MEIIYSTTLPPLSEGGHSPLLVDANGRLRVVVEAGGGGGGSGTEYTEDAAAAANPSGGAVLLRRRDTLTSEVSADGDMVAANGTAKGELVTRDADAIAELVAIKGYVDTLETLIAASNAALDAINAAAQDTTTASPVKPGDATVRGAQYGLGIDTSTALTIPGSTKFAWVQAEGQNARWRHDGATTAPTASSGARILKDQPPVLIPVAMLTSARFIGEASGGKLNIIYAS